MECLSNCFFIFSGENVNRPPWMNCVVVTVVVFLSRTLDYGICSRTYQQQSDNPSVLDPSSQSQTTSRFQPSYIMSYRKHGFWVLTERCFKQTAMKYVDDSIKLSPYRQFCCPVSLISASSSANIPVSPRFFGEFDMLTFTARHFENHPFPVLRRQLENLLKPP